MPKLTPITLLNKSVFKKKIVEIYDPIHLQRYWYVKANSSTEFNEILTKIIPNFKEMVIIDEPEDGDNDGECVAIVIDNHQVILFWANLTSINCISHECLHAVLMCAKSRDINFKEGDDSLCYMFGFLIEEVFTKLKLSIKKEV